MVETQKCYNSRLNYSFCISIHIFSFWIDKYSKSYNFTAFFGGFLMEKYIEPSSRNWKNKSYLAPYYIKKLRKVVLVFRKKSGKLSKWSCFRGGRNWMKLMYELQISVTVIELWISNLFLCLFRFYTACNLRKIERSTLVNSPPLTITSCSESWGLL